MGALVTLSVKGLTLGRVKGSRPQLPYHSAVTITNSCNFQHVCSGKT